MLRNTYNICTPTSAIVLFFPFKIKKEESRRKEWIVQSDLLDASAGIVGESAKEDPSDELPRS